MPVINSSLAGLQSAPVAASVVIPSYQAAGHIRSAVRALLAQNTKIDYEIVVVDSSTDGTDEILREEFPEVRLLHFPHRCQVGTARNIGVEAARAAVVLFVDSDTVPNPTWVNQMYSAIHHLGADAAGGSMSNGTPWSLTGSVGFYLEFFRFVQSGGEPRAARFLVGGNSAFRRELLANIEYLDHSVGEDMLLSSRLARQGKKLLFLPRASVKHLNRTGFRNVFRYQVKLGRGAVLYRSLDSPKLIRLLRVAPHLVFLMPFGVMIWIGFSLLRRGQIQDLLRFSLVLPFCLIANTAWALGFYRSLREEGRDDLQQESIAGVTRHRRD